MEKLVGASTNEIFCRYEDCDTCEEYCPAVNLNSGNCECLEEIVMKLAAYQEIGLEPEQLKEIDKLYLEKCQELNRLREENRWISVEERYPENEQSVEITYCRKRYIGDELICRTGRAFYTDGNHNTSNSTYSWEETEGWDIDEIHDAYVIPEGWWEAVEFSEEFSVVDDRVIAWRPLTEPYHQDKNE